MGENNHLPTPQSLHQAILNLVEPSAPLLAGGVVVR